MTNENSAGKQAEKQFGIQKIYTKDISLETPNSPQMFSAKWEPTVNMEIGTNGQRLAEDVHEVVLAITVTVKQDDKTAYLVEVHQAGIFTVSGLSQEELSHAIGAYCPNILFPYARETVSDLVTRAGFPQLLLAPVNFDALYAQHVQKMQQQGQGEAEPAAESTH